MMESFGQYYVDKILSLPESAVKVVEVPDHSGGIHIVKELFGIKLYYTKSGRKSQTFRACRSEEEARYLRLFMEIGITYDIKIPKSDKYLREILPRMEYIHQVSEEVLQKWENTYTSKKIKQQLRYQVWSKLTKEMRPDFDA